MQPLDTKIEAEYVSAIQKLLDGTETNSIKGLPYMCVGDILQLLTKNFGQEEDELYGDKNGWNLDWWYYMSLKDNYLCVGGSAYNQSTISLWLSDHACGEEIG